MQWVFRSYHAWHNPGLSKQDCPLSVESGIRYLPIFAFIADSLFKAAYAVATFLLLFYIRPLIDRCSQYLMNTRSLEIATLMDELYVATPVLPEHRQPCREIGSFEETSGMTGSIDGNNLRFFQKAANRRNLDCSVLLLLIVDS